MTARLPCTQANIRSRIAAARDAGLHVWGIRPDGTLILGDKPLEAPSATGGQADNATPSKWEDIQA